LDRDTRPLRGIARRRRNSACKAKHCPDRTNDELVWWSKSLRRSTIAWGRRRAARWTRRLGNLDLWIAIAITAGLIAYQVYRHLNPEPQPVIVGRARVIDGDTIDITGARIRLIGIDAPELDQPCTHARGETWPCGRAATRELRAHVGRQDLSCATRGLDAYRRVLAVCSLPDGSDVNAWMVAQGWAVASGFAPTYYAEETQARSAKRGIWSGSFVPPRQWRQHRQ
jgi:endonuclease YncB( thermonuclease family)